MTSIAQIIPAVYEEGVLKPLKKIDLTEHSRVDLVILESKDELGDDSKDVVIAQRKALSKYVGIGNSGLTNVSVNHDKYLYNVE